MPPSEDTELESLLAAVNAGEPGATDALCLAIHEQLRAMARRHLARDGVERHVTIQPTLAATRRITRRKTEYDMIYIVRSARSTPTVVTLRQYGLWRENAVLKESIAGRRIDSGSFAWDVPVPANGETTLTFTVSTSW